MADPTDTSDAGSPTFADAVGATAAGIVAFVTAAVMVGAFMAVAWRVFLWLS